jgi:hypothetical protein
MIEVSATGTVTSGNPYTYNYTGAYKDNGWSHSLNFKRLHGTTYAGLYRYTKHSFYQCHYFDHGYWTFPITGSLNISLQTTDSYISALGGSIVNTAGTKLLMPSTDTTWNIADWDGVDVTGDTTITNNRTNLSNATFIKPSSTSDKLLCFYINTNSELCVETLDWTSSAINVVANSKFIVEADASGVSLGDIKGSASGVGITYENGSKGRFKSLSLDSNMVVTGSSALMTVNSSNVVPVLAYKGNDVFQAWHNNTDTYTTEITVNAYSTSPLIPLGVITENGNAGDAISVATTGVVGGFTGLTVDSEYYYDTAAYDGTVTLTNTGTHIGRAVSATELLLTDLTEQ